MICSADLELHWVSGHSGIPGNEAADRAADSAHGMSLPPPGRMRCETAARLALIREQARQAWRDAWKENLNAAHYRGLAPEVTHRHMRLYDGRAKPHSALLTQLRTGKIRFNSFLHKRRVPGVATAACECGMGRMTVRHVLLICPRWRQERKTMQRKTNTTNIRELLGTLGAATAAIRMVLSTRLLSHFQATSAPEEEEPEERRR